MVRGQQSHKNGQSNPPSSAPIQLPTAQEENPPGIKDIKWVELYTKYRKFIPQEKQQQWKYYREDPGLQKKQAVKKHSKAERELRKKRALPSTTDTADTTTNNSSTTTTDKSDDTTAKPVLESTNTH